MKPTRPLYLALGFALAVLLAQALPSEPEARYTYPVLDAPLVPVEVIDGDTLRVVQDKGNHIYYLADLRIAGVDAPETKAIKARGNGELEKQAGLVVKREVEGWVSERLGRLQVRSDDVDKFGRVLGDLVAEDGTLGEWLLEKGYARPNNGEARGVWGDGVLEGITDQR